MTTRLELALAPQPIRSRFDDVTIEAIHCASEGNPRQIHQVASAVLRGVAPEAFGVESEPVEAATAGSGAAGEALGVATGRATTKKPRPAEKPSAPARRAPVSAAVTVPIAPEEQTPQATLYTVDPPPLASSSAAEDLLPQPLPKLEQPGHEQPHRAPLEPLSRIRVFRSVAIIAAALVATVLAWPIVPLSRPAAKVATAPRGIAPIVTEIPELPPGIATPRSAQPRAAAATAIGPRVGPLSVQVNATPWARIEVDGVDFGATPIADIPLLPGSHTFRARMSDGRKLEKVVEIDESRRFVSFE